MEKEEFVKTYHGTSMYQITVDGKVDGPLVKNMNGMSVIHSRIKNKTVSTLTGELSDQSALNGILNTLFDFQYAVISVMKLQ